MPLVRPATALPGARSTERPHALKKKFTSLFRAL
jgi:hypothetical protein